MQKRKRWQFLLILAVIALTIYNILPTIFYYTKPLNHAIDQKRAKSIAKNIAIRTNNLEDEAYQWLRSYFRYVQLHPTAIRFDKNNPQMMYVDCKSPHEAQQLTALLQRAGSALAFVPSQLTVLEQNDMQPNTIILQRKIPLHFSKEAHEEYFSFVAKKDLLGNFTPQYQNLIKERITALVDAMIFEKNASHYIPAIIQSTKNHFQEQIFFLAQDIQEIVEVFGEDSSVTKRYFSHLFPTSVASTESFKIFLEKLDGVRREIKLQKTAIKEEKLTKEEFQQQLQLLEQKELLLMHAKKLFEKFSFEFTKKPLSWDETQIEALTKESPQNISIIDLQDYNPYIQQIQIDWNIDKVFLKLHSDVVEKGKQDFAQKALYEQLLINEIARINHLTQENIASFADDYQISLQENAQTQSFLLLNLPMLAQKQISQLQTLIEERWHPKHPELQKEKFPIYDEKTYQKLPQEQKALALVLYAPAAAGKKTLSGYKNSSIYVIAKGLNRILQKYQNNSQTEDAQLFFADFQNLQKLLQKNQYFGFVAENHPKFFQNAGDFIFENTNYFQPLLQATRENFALYGFCKNAILEFSTVENRLRKENQIDTKIHEELIKSSEDFYAASANMDAKEKIFFAPPTKNIFWENIKLSIKKYFRGDERKIIHWGLDLSGGKTVQIELRDNNNKPVSDEHDLKQGMNELYNRVNKMGVSEVNIRALNNNIVLDFPGSQGLSAAELVKASSMFFHIVNEKFSLQNSALADHVNRFLMEVWNEASVTNRKDVESLNLIAYKHLYGEAANPSEASPRTQSAKTLYEQGLRLAHPKDDISTNAVNDLFSKIAIFRGDDAKSWHHQMHPLLIVFNNYTLEGANLKNVHAGYDPSTGNYLAFEVADTATSSSKTKYYPGDILHNWTMRYAKDAIQGTSLEKCVHPGNGWRMAVILNNSVITAPALSSADIRHNAHITGNFSQREIQQLASDLKAGSLSFTPHILSEKNVSPELGHQERVQGIIATFVALLAVIIAMVSYYRFSGVIASIAVIFNLLIMWATLQNLQATLTLAGIAGIILTVGMAVDANVLVFERIKEEFAISKRMASAIQSGYNKAFSAIVDSNITTIIAALILLNFDAGPIKGFAITLIIGIISSMFSALFMTRYFFSRWVENTKHTMLKMADLVKTTSFDFLKKSKVVITFSAIIIVLGLSATFYQGKKILGMDFTGGFSVSFEVQKTPNQDYRQRIEKALQHQGLSTQDFQIQQLNPANHIRLLLGVNVEQKGKPFYNMPPSYEKTNTQYPYENNPRLAWIITTLQKEDILLTKQSIQQVDKSWTSMSGQMSQSMKNNAILGLFLALTAIFIYITFRFEFKFAISAMLCLLHDVIISLASIAILHFLKVPVQIDLHTVAALMTIIGYSLNDTIIIFDRIREEAKLMKKRPFAEIVNYALNVTLSRTTITSMTTLLVLLALVILGGSTVFSFALVMTIGVILGTLSSLFVASPLMLLIDKWQNRKTTKKEKILQRIK